MRSALGVIDFARTAPKPKPLSPDGLYALGEQMLAANNKTETECLRQELIKGFSGEE